MASASTVQIGFLGCGAMAQAMAKGIVAAGIFDAAAVLLSDIHRPSLDKMSAVGFQTTSDNSEVVKRSTVVVLAVKPHQALKLVRDHVQPLWQKDRVLMSICAGLSIQDLQLALNSGASKVIRVMPNTCAVVGASASCFAHSATCEPEDLDSVRQLLGAIGICHNIPEHLMAAATGLSGSGPAYVFMMIEALADGGVKGGLPRPVALQLAAQTVLGGGKMVLESGTHPGVLKDQVCSPGGTTIEAVQTLEEKKFRAAVIAAVDASRRKCSELSK